MTATLQARLRPTVEAQIPGSHLGLKWRRASAADLERVLEIVTCTEREDKVVRHTSPLEVEHLVREPNTFLDNLIGVDAAGTIQVFGAVRLHPGETDVALAELFAVTTPRWRGRGIGRALLLWQDARARQMLVDYYGKDSLLPARILNVVDSRSTDRRRMYAAAGFTPISVISVLRWDRGTKERQLNSGGIPAVADPLPAEISLLALTNTNAEQWQEIVRAAVRQLRGPVASRQQAERWWERAQERLVPELSYAAWGKTASFAAVPLLLGEVITTKNSARWLAAGEVDATIEVAGSTGKDEQIMSALLHEVVEAAAANGVEALSAEVDVTATDAQVAPFLYTGFVEVGRRMVYSIDL